MESVKLIFFSFLEYNFLIFYMVAIAHLNRDKIDYNLSVPGIQGYQENALYKSFETSPHKIYL